MIFGAIIFFAFVVQTSAGFGSVMLSLAIGTLFWPLAEILPIVVPLACCLSAYILIRDWREVDHKLLLRLIGPLIAVGMVVGMLLVPHASATSLRLMLGIIVSAAALRGLFVLLSGKSLAAKPGSWSGRVWILGAGIIHGMIATGGPALVYAIESLGLPKRRFRATLAVVWFALNLVLTIKFVSTNTLGTNELPRLARLLPVIAIAIIIGEFLHARVSEKHFRGVVFLLLLVTGGLLWMPFVLS